MRTAPRIAALGLLLASGLGAAQSMPSAVITDPAPDADHPPGFAAVRVPTHGVLINGVLYLASGAAPHPVAILFKGLPGNEQNLDLAQAVRRAGWSVLTFQPRGSWGSPGSYSYHHLLEDAQAVIDFVRNPGNARQYGFDPERLVLIGHSTGGFMAVLTAAADPKVAGLVLISASDDAGEALTARQSRSAWKPWVEDAFANSCNVSMQGCTGEGLGRELLRNADRWSFAANAEHLAGRPLLVVTADEGLAPESESLVRALEKNSSSPAEPIQREHFPTDHYYSGYRIALQAAVVDWLQRTFPKAATVP